MREYRILYSMLRNFMSLFIKSIKFLASLYHKLLANLVAEVGTRHSHQILFWAHVFYQRLSKVSANERSPYICKIFFHWLKPWLRPGGRLNIKMLSYQYRVSHYKDKTHDGLIFMMESHTLKDCLCIEMKPWALQASFVTIRSFPWLSGKLWYLQHGCVGDIIVYH